MSTTNKKKLNQIRIKLDKLDNDLLRLIKKRSSLVNEVLKIKIPLTNIQRWQNSSKEFPGSDG